MVKRLTAADLQNPVIAEGEKVLLALSGGVDSVVLFHLLHDESLRKHFTLCAAHVEHGLRGAEALEDMAFVTALCRQNQVPLYTLHIDAKALAKAEGKTIEQAARDHRYRFFIDCLKDMGGHLLFTAHHMDDQAESILLHILRGSGLKGLCGMQTVSDHRETGFDYRLCRPMLTVSKGDILYTAQQNRWAYREDKTNTDTAYTRNYLRQEILPRCQRVNTKVTEALCRLSRHVSADEAYLQEKTQEVLPLVLKGDTCGIPELLKQPLPILYRLLLIFAGEDSTAATEGLLALCKGQTGDRLQLKSGMVQKSYDRLIFIREPFTFEQPMKEGLNKLPDGREVEVLQVLKPPDLKIKGLLFLDRIPMETVLRTKRPGDRFYPLGAPGERLLSDYLTDKKIACRDNLVVLATDKNIWGICGLEVSEKVKITKDSHEVWQIKMNNIIKEG